MNSRNFRGIPSVRDYFGYFSMRGPFVDASSSHCRGLLLVDRLDPPTGGKGGRRHGCVFRVENVGMRLGHAMRVGQRVRRYTRCLFWGSHGHVRASRVLEGEAKQRALSVLGLSPPPPPPHALLPWSLGREPRSSSSSGIPRSAGAPTNPAPTPAAAAPSTRYRPI